MDLLKIREEQKIYGEEQLSTRELFASILGTTVNANVENDFLRKMNTYSRSELNDLGFTKTQINKIEAITELNRRFENMKSRSKVKIKDPDIVFQIMKNKLYKLKKEEFHILLLDTKTQLIKDCLIAIGSLNSAIVHPREVFNKAVKESACSLIAVHNHPSGDAKPSKNDDKITQRLKDAGEILGIKLIDHIIIGDECYYSYKKNEKI